MALDRTWYNTLADDSGSNTDGTVWDKAAVDSLMDAIDAEVVHLAASAYNSATQTITNNTETVITFDSEDFDASGFHSTSVNTGRMTVPGGTATRIYRVRAQTFFVTTGAGTIGYLSIRKNGTRVRASYQNLWASMTLTLMVDAYISLAAADYVDVVFLQNTGSSVSVGSATAEYASRLEIASVT